MATQIEFTDKDVYTYVPSAGSGEGVSFALADMPAKTLMNAITRGLNHVFSNESISKGSTAKKNKPETTPAEYEAIITAARQKFLADMKAGTWGDGARGPRMPAENRLEQIYNNFCMEDVRKLLATSNRKPGETKDTWLDDQGDERPIQDWMAAYVHPDNPLGPDRKAGLMQRAKIKHDAEVADAAARKAAKDREAKASGIGLTL